MEINNINFDNFFKIYTAFSEDAASYLDDMDLDAWVEELQLGCADCVNRYGHNYDDDGDDHISEKNRLFAEMTGAYWIWKRAPYSEYKGLCHYRRYFMLSHEDIEWIRDCDVDVILTTPRFAPGGIKEMFLAETPVKEPVMTELLQAVNEMSEDDGKAFDSYLNECFYFPNNMAVAKSGIYDSYCEWIFPILFRLEGLDKEKGYGHENDRHIAYASEVLTSYYFWKNKAKWKTFFTDYKLYR